ncbi:hypothetical protein Glov_0780 [Trichlorobacter lovleyi SZ]|uniref:Glycosyl transferase family 9 n=2 Tax=Trichlorobacter lovleyi TaxID=313985 RepID=B3E4J1_TRIL1|nr:hypothetical protein Glov_0780 [Trichlorobacter lovleyi SZ]
MNILLYHFGYRGDILVVGQHFTRELLTRYPHADIDLMVRPRMVEAGDFMMPLGVYRDILWGEKKDFHLSKESYDLAYMIDENVYPEGNLRTPFTKAGFPFRHHKLSLTVMPEDKALATRIIADLPRPIIAVQSDMSRKWPAERCAALNQRLAALGSLVTLGPDERYPSCEKPLSFLQSAALAASADIFVGIDSGIAHAAALMGVQTVLIPPVFPESWISPTEYANPFIADEACRHISIRPHPEDFCGHYFCLRPTAQGGIQPPGGNSLLVKCRWKKRFGIFKGNSCFNKISVDALYDVVVAAMKKRRLI